MSLGVKVKALREEKEMNQKDLAVASKITQATISRIEKGQVQQLKSEALKRLAGALDVTVDYLVGAVKKGRSIELSLDTEMLPESPRLYLDYSESEGLVRSFRKLPQEKKQVVLDFVRFLVQQEKERRKKLDEKIVRLEAAEEHGKAR